MSDEVADAIANGREYIEKNGWWRGHFLGPNKRQACALGGLMFGNGLPTTATSYGKDRLVIKQAVERLASVIDPRAAREAHELEAIPHYTQYVANSIVWDWNDSKGKCKNKQELLDLFAKAEKIERAGFDPDGP